METLLVELKNFGLSEKQENDIRNNYSFGYNFIVRTTTKLVAKGKTTWNVETVCKEICSEAEHKNATNVETIKFFKRLGGKETLTRSYTSAGYVVTKIVSTCPNKNNRTIREYNFFCRNYDLSIEKYLQKVVDSLKK